MAGFGAYGAVHKPLAQFAPAAILSKNVLFRNPAEAGINADGTLTPTSPLRRGPTDGKDIGVDFDELQRALRPQPAPR